MCPNTQSLDRAKELQQKTTQYISFKHNMQQVEAKREQFFHSQKQRMLSYFQATEEDWNDWHWQMKHRITSVEELSHFVSLTEHQKQEIELVSKTSRFAIVPYYLAHITDQQQDPIKALSIPTIAEILDTHGETDPMGEEFTNPAGSITRRYPDRLIINVTNMCAMYCRHCQRRRLIGETDHHTSQAMLQESIQYIREHQEIRDVLLTGGDALLLSDQQLEQILVELRAIPHVEIIRIGTRTPVTMPMRITESLVKMIQKYHPVYVNTHYNHPFELTKDSMVATRKMSLHGINVGNQTVLLSGINDDPFTMMYLNQKLLIAHVRPYYIFHAKSVKGTHHFKPSITRGLQIMEYLRGHTSGLAIPTYIMNAPKGLGKVPLLPSYITQIKQNVYQIRTWENKTFIYDDTKTGS